MLEKNSWFTILTVLVTGLMAGNTIGAGIPYEINSLKGLKAVKVVVEHLSEDARKAGLSTERLKAAAERHLNKNGIKVDENAEPYVYINCIALKSPNVKGEMVYSLSISVRQPVSLVKNQKIQTFGATWNSSGVGITGPGEPFASKQELRLLQLLDKLVNDYRKANP